MTNVIKSILWYITKPDYYSELSRVALILIKEKLHISKNTKKQTIYTKNMYRKIAISTEEAIFKLTGKKKFSLIRNIFKKEFFESEEKERKFPVKMGGAANLDLLYHLAEHLQAKKVIETGIASGWSSLSILLSLQKREHSILISTDKPYPGMNNETYVGSIVPSKLKEKWKIIKLPDRKAIPKSIKLLKEVDLCHYDSDKTYEGRTWSYPRLWRSLRKGGIFISDDIGDNLGFHNFCKKIRKKPMIVENNGNFVGVLIKD